MNIVYFLVPLALALGLGFIAFFIFSSHRGQFDDLDTPAHRMLLDDEAIDKMNHAKIDGFKNENGIENGIENVPQKGKPT